MSSDSFKTVFLWLTAVPGTEEALGKHGWMNRWIMERRKASHSDKGSGSLLWQPYAGVQSLGNEWRLTKTQERVGMGEAF